MYTLYFSPGSVSLVVHCLLNELGVPFELKRLSTVCDVDHSEPQLSPHVLARRAVERETAGSDLVDPIAHGRQHHSVADVDAELVATASSASVAIQTAERPETACC